MIIHSLINFPRSPWVTIPTCLLGGHFLTRGLVFLSNFIISHPDFSGSKYEEVKKQIYETTFCAVPDNALLISLFLTRNFQDWTFLLSSHLNTPRKILTLTALSVISHLFRMFVLQPRLYQICKSANDSLFETPVKFAYSLLSPVNAPPYSRGYIFIR